MKGLIIIALTLTTEVCFGQDGSWQVQTYAEGDTMEWYKQHMLFVKTLGLEEFQTIEVDWAFRLWTEKQVIEARQVSDVLSGQLVNWTYQDSDQKQTTINSPYTKVENLTKPTVARIEDQLALSGIRNIPDQSFIENWNSQTAGVYLVFEFVDNGIYYFKTYLHPESQDSIPEAKVVQSFIDDLLEVVHADNSWKYFTDNLPFPCYINHGPMVICNVKSVNYGSRKQWRRAKRKAKREKSRK